MSEESKYKNLLIKDYIMKQKLGTGSFGVVFKVLKKTDKNFYVLKQISLFNMNKEQIEEVKNEAKILSSLNSKFVVKYLESFVLNNNLNIVMEYCDGGDLSLYLKEYLKVGKYLPEEKIWKIFIQICLGINYIHSKKILHRDLKTMNIFLMKDERVRIGDLGVAKVLNQNSFANTFVGTPYYLSPEICEEKPYNEKSDIWALGCILYEMATFRHPFNATNQGALIIKILTGNYEQINNKDYSNDLRRIVNSMLEKIYLKRPSVKDILKNPIIIKKIKQYNLEEFFQNELSEFYQVNIVESPSFNMNFKNIIFSDNIIKDNNSKDNPQFSNALMQKQSKLLLNNKEVKKSNADVGISQENKKAKVVSVNLNAKNSNNELKEVISKNEKVEMKKYILRPKKLSANNKKSSELNLKNNMPNQFQNRPSTKQSSETKPEGLLINNIVISSPKVVNKSDKIAHHPILNPNYIIGKKENNQEKQSNFSKNQDFKINLVAEKENKKNQENNKKLKEKIKEKAKTTELLLNDNKISYENEKIMKKIDEFDARLFKNVYQKNINNKPHNKEIKISYVEKVEQDHNNYLSNDFNPKKNQIKGNDKSKEKKTRHNHNIQLDLAEKKNENQKISSEIKNEKIQSNKNVTKNKIDPMIIDNLFPYSKDILSNKNGGQAKNLFKNNYLLCNILSNREEEPEEKLNLINEIKNKSNDSNNKKENKEIKIEMKTSLELTPSKLEEFSEKNSNINKNGKFFSDRKSQNNAQKRELIDFKKFVIPKEESKVEQNLDRNEILKSEKKEAERKEPSNKQQGYIEIKLNLIDFKEKADKKLIKGENTPIANDFKESKADNVRENNNINNTTNTSNINSKTDSSYALRNQERAENTNTSHNLSLLDKLMKNNNIKPKKNSDYVDSNTNDKNKTSDNISGKFLNTNQSDESSFILCKKLSNEKKENKDLNKNKTDKNFAIPGILNFGKTNIISFEKSKLLSNRLKENKRKKDLIDNVPLWIENENKDLDFSVNTVCYDRKDNKLNSMPNNFKNDPDSIRDIKIDNSQNFEMYKKNLNGNISYIDKLSCGTDNSYEKSAYNVNVHKSQNFNNRPQSGVLFESDENNKQFLTNYENFKNESNDSLMSNYSKISSEKLNNLNNISEINDGFDSGEETVFIRREDSNNKKEEKNEILIKELNDMKKKFTIRIENIKRDLKERFGKEAFGKIYTFYKKEEKNISKDDSIMEKLQILMNETFAENSKNFNEIFIGLLYYEVQLENVLKELAE